MLESEVLFMTNLRFGIVMNGENGIEKIIWIAKGNLIVLNVLRN